MRKHLWIVIVVLAGVLASCAPAALPPPGNLSPIDAQELLERKSEIGLFVLNVHTPYEGKLSGTDAIIEDWKDIAAHNDQLPADKQKPIFVYCRTGRMSTSAVEQLRALGYTSIYHLEGGMIAWDKAGLPVIEKSWK